MAPHRTFPGLFAVASTLVLGCAAGDAPAASSVPDTMSATDASSDGRASDDAGFDVTSIDATPASRCTRIDWIESDRPGPDGAWGTDDDRRVAHETALLDDGARVVTEIVYRAAGADGVWGTDDDEIEMEDVYTYALATDVFPETRTEHSGAGADGAWLTADDELGVVEKYDVDASGRLRGSIAYAHDAPMTSTTCRTPDGMKLPRDYLYSSDPGPDGTYLTSDDVFFGRTENVRDAADVIQSSFQFSAAGPNGAWGDDDDVISGVLVYDCAHQTMRASGGTGADGTWGTADDPIVSAWRIVGTPSGCGGYDICKAAIR